MNQMIWSFLEKMKSIFNFIYKNKIIIYTYVIKKTRISRNFPVSIYKNRKYNPAQHFFIN